ncbi:hypothetical protein Tco_1001652 [Tanacetum coccineum]
MAMRTQPTLSPGMSARIAEAAALSLSSFRKRYRSSYETPSPSSSLTLPVRKRYQGTSELSKDTEGESSEPDFKREGSEDESSDSDNEWESYEDEGPGMKKEEEAGPEGQQAVLVVDTAMSEPLGLGYGETRHRVLESTKEIAPSMYEVGQSSRSMLEQERAERISAFRQSALITWVNPKDGRVYTDILTYVPPVAPVLTPPSPKWSSGSFQVHYHP